MTARPNILLIMSDNHAADLLGCYGNEEIYTPHLDRLAREGMQFNNAYCVNAMCSPCRASVLTGLMPSQHGIHTWIDDRKMDNWPPAWNALAEFETLPESLQQNGYQTALIGKYHLGSPFSPQNGFEHWVTFPHGHTRTFWDNTIIDNGREYRHEGHTVDFFSQKAIEYLESREGDQPFFLFLTYNGPYGHWPAIQGPAKNRFASRYADTPMHSVPREGVRREVFERVLLTMEDSGQGLDYSALLSIMNDLTTLRNFYSQMSVVDDGVGRVLAALEEQGLADDTLVIYTSDHGMSLGHHGFWGHGQATWPANAHRAAYSIPLLMRHPQCIAAAQQSDLLVSQLDLFATILDYAGVERPAAPPSPSRSFSHSLQNDSVTWEEVIFIEQEEMRAIRTAEWLFVQRFKGSETFPLKDELYKLDGAESVYAAEQNSVIDAPENAAVVAKFSQRLDDFFEQYGNPKYDLWRGGRAKSNTSRPWLWPEVWGEEWRPVYE